MQVTIHDIHAAARAASCPICESDLQARFRQTDGVPFLGCAKFPKCKGTRPLNIDVRYELVEKQGATIAPERLLADCATKS